jgi:GTP cyclohydrolase I
MKSEVDQRQTAIENHVREILKILKVDLTAEQFRDTPKRIARMAFELLAGMDETNEPKLTLFENSGYRDILIVKDIPFYSLCAATHSEVLLSTIAGPRRLHKGTGGLSP